MKNLNQKPITIFHDNGITTLKLYVLEMNEVMVNATELLNVYGRGVILKKTHPFLQTQFDFTKAPPYQIILFDAEGYRTGAKMCHEPIQAPVSYLIPEPYVLLWPFNSKIDVESIISIDVIQINKEMDKDHFLEIFDLMNSDTDEELVARFNNEVNIKTWTSARSRYLRALREQLKKRNISVGQVGDYDSGLSYKSVVWLKHNSLYLLNTLRREEVARMICKYFNKHRQDIVKNEWELTIYTADEAYVSVKGRDHHIRISARDLLDNHLEYKSSGKKKAGGITRQIILYINSLRKSVSKQIDRILSILYA